MNFDEHLIKFIQERPYIWDRSNNNYRNINLKDAEWYRVANELNTTVDRCKKRWGTLRDRYKRVMKKWDKKDDGEPYSQKWKYQDRLSFLSTSVPSENNITLEESLDENGCTADTLIVTEEERLIGNSSDIVEEKKPKLDLSEYFTNFVEEARNAVTKMQTVSSNSETIDTNESFFNYLAKRVKAANLDQMQEMQIEADILHFTLQRINELRNDNI